MADFAITIAGLEEVQRRLRAAPDKLRRRVLGTALLRAAYPIRDSARILAPVDTGLLRSRIVATRGRVRNRTEMDAKVGVRMVTRGSGQRARTLRKLKRMQGKGLVRLKGQGFDDPHYWRFLEFGTTRMGAIGYLTTAAKMNARRSVEIIERELLARVDELTKP